MKPILILLFVFYSLPFHLYSNDHLKEFGLKKSYSQKLFKEAGIQNPSSISLIAYDIFVYSKDLYQKGEYEKSKNLLDKLWKKYPIGSNEWHKARIDDSLLNVGSPTCYYAMRMLTDTLDWKLREQKNPTKDAKEIQFTVVLAGKSEGIQPQSLKDLESERGIQKTNTLHPKLKESNFSVVHNSMWLFNEYISAITEGKLKLKTKIVYLKDLTISEKCVMGNCSPFGDYPGAMRKQLSDEIIDQTDFYWLIHPSHVPDHVKDFNNMGFVTGGMGRFQDSPLWISDDLFLVRKRLQKLGTPYREEEVHAYFPQWLMHEFYHYLFKAYPEFQLEKESHQWFKRDLWPSDFVGQFEADYYTEALHKRILPQGKPLWTKLRIASRITEYLSYITPKSLEGDYERRPVQNGWHEGKIKKIDNKNSYQWINSANVKWSLEFNSKKGILETGKDNPYKKDSDSSSKSFKILLKKNSNGEVIMNEDRKGERFVEVEGFQFKGETYYKK